MSQGCGGESAELILVKEFELCCAGGHTSSHGGDGEALRDQRRRKKRQLRDSGQGWGHSDAGSQGGDIKQAQRMSGGGWG